MKIQIECLPCLINQLIRTLKFMGKDEKQIKKLLDVFSCKLKEISLNWTPPEGGKLLYDFIREQTKEKDPYKFIKKKSIKKSLKFYNNLKKTIKKSKYPLLTAVKVSILGNIIDFGAQDTFDLDKELEEFFSKKFNAQHFDIFKDKLKKSDTILMIGDNAGETVFDRLLLEEIDSNKKIFYSVRETPIINDATYEDAKNSGLDSIATIISTGSGIPGILIDGVSKKFKDIFYSADMVLSKGQGNFETLSDIDREIFFLFKIKCDTVSKILNLPLGESILLYHKK